MKSVNATSISIIPKTKPSQYPFQTSLTRNPKQTTQWKRHSRKPPQKRTPPPPLQKKAARARKIEIYDRETRHALGAVTAGTSINVAPGGRLKSKFVSVQRRDAAARLSREGGHLRVLFSISPGPPQSSADPRGHSIWLERTFEIARPSYALGRGRLAPSKPIWMPFSRSRGKDN